MKNEYLKRIKVMYHPYIEDIQLIDDDGIKVWELYLKDGYCINGESDQQVYYFNTFQELKDELQYIELSNTSSDNEYLVLQVEQNQYGNSDMNVLVGRYATYMEAVEKFNFIKERTEGWYKTFDESYLVTEIHLYIDGKFVEIIDSEKVKF